MCHRFFLCVLTIKLNKIQLFFMFLHQLVQNKTFLISEVWTKEPVSFYNDNVLKLKQLTGFW